MPRWTCALITFALVHSPGQADEFFEKKIRPLLVDRCHACHGPQKQKGGLRLDSVEAFRKGGDSGPTTELIVEAVGYSSGLKMPPTGKLTDAEIADIARWVKDGAKWPGDPTRHSGRSEAPESSRQSVTRAGSPEHWAFRPVTDPPVPAVRDASWPTSPIDRFLLAALEAKGLRPAPPANKRVWLRRVTYDLTGLPPTPAEIEGFLAADSPDACRMVVDRLLASPAYGERWGRHWLDVARYADSNGLDENTGFANAWRYRDYVIAAFNADKPFDRFVVEQLAGDLLRSDDPTPLADRLTATGLLALGPKLLAEVDKEKMVMDIVDEQIDVVSKAFLGLTLSCARCHDHKFDPFPTTDYYALAGIFKSTKTMATLATVAKALERPLDGDDAKAAAVEERRDKLKKKKDERKRVADRVKAAGDDAKPTDRDRLPKLDAEIADLEKNPPPVVAMALSVRDEKQPGPSRVHVRGNHLTLGAEVPRGFPRALGEAPQVTVPQSGRLELARWIADAKNPLTARVIVNRVWQHHFGEGLVRSPDNFGRLGDRPTHAELLDWLATRFVESGWSVKALHRTIVLSSAYRMASAGDADSDNSLLTRFPRRRIEAEALRDGILAVSGQLDRTVGGDIAKVKGFEYVNGNQPALALPRRSVYLPVIRNDVYDLFQTFDFPEPSVPNGKRAATTVAPQALFLMNSPFVRDQAGHFAKRLLDGPSRDDAERVAEAYRRAFAREPRESEIAAALAYVIRRGWADYCHALFASNEFVTLD